MRALRSALKLKRPALVLLAQETALLLLVFLVYANWFASWRGNGYFAHDFNLAHFAALLVSSPALPVVSHFTVIIFLLFFLVRVFFMAGIFSSLVHGYSGFGVFLSASARNFLRFTVSLFLYIIPGMIFSLFLGRGLDWLIGKVDHTQWVFFLGLGKQFLIFIWFSIVAYFYSLSRLAITKQGRFTLVFRGSAKKLLAYLGYNTLALLLMLLASFLSLLLIFKKSGFPFLLAMLLFQLGMFGRIILQLAAYRSAEKSG